MASIFRQVTTCPLPATATIVERDGKRFAQWRGKNGERRTAELSGDGQRVRIESRSWYIEYVDHQGTTQRVKGFTNRIATEQRAADLERQAARVQVGLAAPPNALSQRSLAELLALSSRLRLSGCRSTSIC
jgi:hypothetical protein